MVEIETNSRDRNGIAFVRTCSLMQWVHESEDTLSPTAGSGFGALGLIRIEGFRIHHLHAPVSSPSISNASICLSRTSTKTLLP